MEVLPRFDESSPEVFRPVHQARLNSLESEDNEPESMTTTAVQPASSTSPLICLSTPPDSTQANEPKPPEIHHTKFYDWLITTVILDNLSYREPFINSARDANQLSEQDLFHHAVDLYRNANQLDPQVLVNLPFIPRTMRTGETMLDIPFLDPLLVVMWHIHIDDVHWMLNVLPWRVVDRPIRTGRSLLAWIVDIQDIHGFLEKTRAPLSVTMKLIRFLDNYCE